jgi:hypothetical protein
MTSVNISSVTNTVVATENGTSTVVTVPQTSTVTAVTAGPQGAAGAAFPLNETGKVDKSIIYYDLASGLYKADSTWTVATLVFGGDY